MTLTLILITAAAVVALVAVGIRFGPFLKSRPHAKAIVFLVFGLVILVLTFSEPIPPRGRALPFVVLTLVGCCSLFCAYIVWRKEIKRTPPPEA